MSTFSMGGDSVLLTLNANAGKAASGFGAGAGTGAQGGADQSTVEKHIKIVDYLRRLPEGARADYVDIQRSVGVDLGKEIGALGMLKSNPKVDQEAREDGSWSFQFRARYHIHNRAQLLKAIQRNRWTGLVESDVRECYEGVSGDIKSLIVGGDIIAVKNSVEFKSLVLYPRGRPFLTKLSCVVTAAPGEQMLQTSGSLQTEIRRGEAICVGGSWFRVGSAIGSGAEGQQIQRNSAKPSVTLDRDLEVKEKDEEGAGAGAGALSKVASRARHQYFDPYTAEKLPLDGDYDGAALFQGPALRHGCTSDVKECWRETSLSVRRFLGEHALLRRELADLNLVSSTSLSHQPAKKFKVQAKRKATKRRVTSTATGFGVNQHLRGTDMERILRETRDKNEREDMGSR